MAVQPAHFFDRVQPRDRAAAAVPRAYPYRNDVTGRYFLSDSTVAEPGTTRVYFDDDGTGHVNLDDAAGDRTAIYFGGSRVQL